MIQAPPHAGLPGFPGHRQRPAGPCSPKHELVEGFPGSTSTTSTWVTAASELITMTLQALLDNGDQASFPHLTIRCGRRRPRWPAEHRCTYPVMTTQGWQPDIADL